METHAHKTTDDFLHTDSMLQKHILSSPNFRQTHIASAHNVQMDSKFWRRLEEATPEMRRQDRSPWLQKLCGVGQSSVSRWKSGQNHPTMENLIAISNATGYCIQWLLTGNGPRRWRQESPDIAKMLDLLESLSEKDRAEILRFAEFRKVGS